MLDISGNIKCDRCGCKVNLLDVGDGEAYNQMILPDSYYSEEEYESYCRYCYSKMKRKNFFFDISE